MTTNVNNNKYILYGLIGVFVISAIGGASYGAYYAASTSSTTNVLSKITNSPSTTIPSSSPTNLPLFPTKSPTTKKPVRIPTMKPSMNPTTNKPSRLPTIKPSSNPTNKPSNKPSISPTRKPSSIPTKNPFIIPTMLPSMLPTSNPITLSPTNNPTLNPTVLPSSNPTLLPTLLPTTNPTLLPTSNPTMNPTILPTNNPTINPTNNPTTNPTSNPTLPTSNPTVIPTRNPTKNPTRNPTKNPTRNPTKNPTRNPTKNPTRNPTLKPTTKNPTRNPTKNPTRNPTLKPTTKTPTKLPTKNPTNKPTNKPTTKTPTKLPTKNPTKNPTRPKRLILYQKVSTGAECDIYTYSQLTSQTVNGNANSAMNSNDCTNVPACHKLPDDFEATSTNTADLNSPRPFGLHTDTRNDDKTSSPTGPTNGWSNSVYFCFRLGGWTSSYDSNGVLITSYDNKCVEVAASLSRFCRNQFFYKPSDVCNGYQTSNGRCLLYFYFINGFGSPLNNLQFWFGRGGTNCGIESNCNNWSYSNSDGFNTYNGLPFTVNLRSYTEAPASSVIKSTNSCSESKLIMCIAEVYADKKSNGYPHETNKFMSLLTNPFSYNGY